MAKETNNAWVGVFMIGLSFFMIYKSFQSPLSVEDHLYIEGAITNLETHRQPKRTTYHTFSIKNKYKGKVFDNYPILRISKRSQRITSFFEENAVIGFHVERKQMDEPQIDIFSLTANGKVIAPLDRKRIIKYWDLAIGLFLLIGSFFLIWNSY